VPPIIVAISKPEGGTTEMLAVNELPATVKLSAAEATPNVVVKAFNAPDAHN
jgi:hypothetical protein